MATVSPVIGIVAPGAMGSAVARRLHEAGCTILTNLDGRSEDSKKRAKDAGMEDTSLEDIALRASWILSILPPKDARSFAERFIAAHSKAHQGSGQGQETSNEIVFVDCNAVNPKTVKAISSLFETTSPKVHFIDASIIGGPPTAGYDPTFYASAETKDEGVLDGFVSLSQYGLKTSPLKGEGVGIGDASALKMSYAGISKGTTGLMATMILAAYAASPATAEALLEELKSSQPIFLRRIATAIPSMIPKAYRWSGEMEEIAGFVGDGEEDVYHGLAKLYERVEKSESGEVETLMDFVGKAKHVL
ncbi:hypothetical protein ONZ45_g2072 [Pleurotus djamor]|nr:hypothetical protein ONZ45_g2072 [Pleurotus djamor]